MGGVLAAEAAAPPVSAAGSAAEEVPGSEEDGAAGGVLTSDLGEVLNMGGVLTSDLGEVPNMGGVLTSDLGELPAAVRDRILHARRAVAATLCFAPLTGKGLGVLAFLIACLIASDCLPHRP